MTEQEIIEYLKKNKTEGRILAFMPEEVREWCEEHKEELLVWQSNNWYGYDVDDICTDDVVTLLDDYKVKEEPEGGWAEFAINKNGDFAISGFRNDKNITIIYNWTQWNKPIRDNASENFVNGCCAFGGWQYKEEPSLWTLSPMVGKDGSAQNFYGADLTVKPIIPVKIRFWRNINDD